MASRFSLEAILSLTDNLTGPYKNTTRKVTGLNSSLSRSFNKLNAGINRGLKRAAQVGLVALGAGLAIATREFIKLDDAATQAGAKFKDLDVRASNYQETLKQISNTSREAVKGTEFLASAGAGALDKFAMAGFTSAQSMALLKGTVDVGTAANTDLVTAVDIATDSLGAFNLVVKDEMQLEKNLTRVSDVMIKTTTTANTSFEDLFESVKAGAPAFTAAGQSMETFSALAGKMANAGVKGSTSGTNLRNMALRLAKPTGEAADVLKTLGVQTQDTQGNFRDMIDILGDFEKGLKGMGTAQTTAALTTVFGARAVTGVNILLAEGSDSLRTYREDLINSGGATKTMAEAMRQSLGNRLKVIKSGLIEIGLKFIEAFEEKGRGALDKLIAGIQNFDVQPIVDGAIKFIGFMEKLIPIAIKFGPAILGIVAAVKLWSIAQGILNIALMANPITLWVTAIAAVIIGIAALAKAWKKIQEERGTALTQQESNQMGLKGFNTRTGGRSVEATDYTSRGGYNRDAMVQARQQQAVQETRSIEESRQRNDIFLHGPSGTGISTTPGGSPETAVRLGVQ